jgi:hypothetical protein
LPGIHRLVIEPGEYGMKPNDITVDQEFHAGEKFGLALNVENSCASIPVLVYLGKPNKDTGKIENDKNKP